jgi:hypothetical protein
VSLIFLESSLPSTSPCIFRKDKIALIHAGHHSEGESIFLRKLQLNKWILHYLEPSLKCIYFRQLRNFLGVTVPFVLDFQ